MPAKCCPKNLPRFDFQAREKPAQDVLAAEFDEEFE
jgi:hypothetical protein